MNIPKHYRLSFWRAVFFLIMAVGLVVTAVRFTKGLGAVTNLTDHYAWGIWKAFNVLVAIGLGGAGFTLMGMVYVFNAERFRPIVRPTVIMAFLCYLSSAISLFIDIGRSWTIWHPIVMWNHSSVLFEVAWCLMLYTVVLILEGSGMLFEKLGWNRMVHVQHAVSLPIVIVGVVLSTLHQSSLGSLFLIVPGKLHALWYTPMLPVLFFSSAIMAGIAMILVLSHLTGRAFNRRLDLGVLSSLARILVGFLAAFTVTRFFDLWVQGHLGAAFTPSYEAGMFWAESLLFLFVPFAILSSPRRRRSFGTLYAAGLSVVFGFILNRLNVCITGFEGAQGGHYIPSWEEVSITLMVVAAVFGTYRMAVRFLPVFPAVESEEPEFRVLHAPVPVAASRQRRTAAG